MEMKKSYHVKPAWMGASDHLRLGSMTRTLSLSDLSPCKRARTFSNDIPGSRKVDVYCTVLPTSYFGTSFLVSELRNYRSFYNFYLAPEAEKTCNVDAAKNKVSENTIDIFFPSFLQEIALRFANPLPVPLPALVKRPKNI
jgi:hypothetical protein